MCQAGGRYDGTGFAQVASGQFRMLLQECPRNIVAQGTSYAGHLQTVGQPVVDEYASREREHLRFVLQTSERCREYKTVIIALEFRAVVFPDLVIFFQSQSFVGYQLLPIHIHSSRFFTKVIKKVDIRSFSQKINGCVPGIGYFCTSKTIISTYNGSTCY